MGAASNVLMVHDYPPLTGGGLALGALELVGLLPPGCRWRIVSSRLSDHFADDRAAYAAAGPRPCCSVVSSRRALRLIGQAHVVVVHWTFSFRRLSTLAVVAGPLLGTPTVCIIHTAPAHCQYNRMRRLPAVLRRPVMALLRSALQRCEHVVALGEAHAVALRRAGIAPSRVLPLPVGSPRSGAHPAAGDSMPRSGATVGFAGELSSLKGADALPRLVRELTPSLAFRIAGQGVLLPVLVRTVSSLPADRRAAIALLGFVPPNEMAAFYDSIDAVLVLSRTESQCRVALEAMQAGVVVLTRNHGEAAHVVQHGVTGYHVDPADPATVARVLAQLVAQPDHAAALRARARAHARDALERSRADWSRFLADVTGGGAGR